MPLHIDYRPRNFDEVIGNEETVSALKSVLRRKDRPHTFLLTGPAGCGKTTLGRIIQKEVECSDYDFTEVNVADNTGVDFVREIIQQMRHRPMNGKARVWLLDECHKFTEAAQNALLKPTEDTPPHVYFVLASSEPQKLIKALRSRGTPFPVEHLKEDQLLELLNDVLASEGVKDFPKDALKVAAKNAQGSPRNALVILDKIIDLPDDEKIKAAERSMQEESQTIDLCRLLLENKPKWASCSKILQGLNIKDGEAEGVRRAILGYLKAVLLKNGNGRTAYVMSCFIEPFYNTGVAGLVLATYMATQDA